MGDVCLLLTKLGIAAKSKEVEDKALEYFRVASARLGCRALGAGEVCKAAACVDLACMTLQVPLDSTLVVRCSGSSQKVYRVTRATLQKLLGVRSGANARDLCIQFGCARHEGAVRSALALYQERFVERLPPMQRDNIDFKRSVFLATAFFLVARKNRVSVDRQRLLGGLGVTAAEFAQTTASMAELLPDIVGVKDGARKRTAKDVETAARSGADGRDGISEETGSGKEEVGLEASPGYKLRNKKQRSRECEAQRHDQPQQSTEAKAARSRGASKGKQGVSEKQLRHAVLSFAAEERTNK